MYIPQFHYMQYSFYFLNLVLFSLYKHYKY
nr:MAG TPA: hypothetical protein [Crassvirales sp.]